MNRWIVEENYITQAFGKFDLGVNRSKVRPVLCDQCYEVETSENPAIPEENALGTHLAHSGLRALTKL